MKLTRFQILVFAALLAGTAGWYSYTIFSNFCIDGDLLNWAESLQPLAPGMTFLNSFGVKEWFAKFHLGLFPLLYLTARAYSPWGGMDFLMAFKILTLVSASLTPLLIFVICKNSMRYWAIMLFTSFIPLYLMGYSWLITTCDNHILADFFNLAYIVCLLIATGAICPAQRDAHYLSWAFITGIMAALSISIHFKNMAALPVMLALFAVTPPAPRTRLRIGAAGVAGLFLTFGLLYFIYWTQSAGEPLQSKLDFWVFHRVPGRFFFTPPPPPLRDHLVFVYVGIRGCLYTLQELVINTNLFDHDLIGPVAVGLFFILYFASAYRMRRSRLVRILFLVFLCDAVHSFFYDPWVIERWDSVTLWVIITIGICWDAVMSRENGRGRFRCITLSILIISYFSTLVWSSARSTYLLLGITSNRIPYQPSAIRWPYRDKIYFYFDHQESYDFARKFDSFFSEGTYFLSPRFLGGPQTHVHGMLNQYLALYSKSYRDRMIENPNIIGPLVEAGVIKKLLYIDTLRIPWYVGTQRSIIMFDPSTTRTVYKNNQMVVNKAQFIPQKVSANPAR